MIIGVSGKAESGKDTIGKIIQYLTMKSINIKNTQSYSEFCNYYNKWVYLSKDNNIAGYNHWKIKKFADKVKDIVCLLIGCTKEQLEDEEFKNKELGKEWVRYNHINEHELTPRKLLQLVGTEFGRDMVHPNLWVNALFINYKKELRNYGAFSNSKEYYDNIKYNNWIITDVRFPNEVKAIEDRDGFIIRIESPQYCEGCEIKTLETQDCKDCIVYQEDYNNQHSSEIALDDYNNFKYTIDNSGTIEELINKVKIILIKEGILHG